MLSKNIPGAKKARPSQKHQLAILIIHSTKKCDIWLMPRPKLLASSFVRSNLYISDSSVSHQLRSATNTIASYVPLKSLIKYMYTCMIHGLSY